MQTPVIFITNPAHHMLESSPLCRWGSWDSGFLAVASYITSDLGCGSDSGIPAPEPMLPVVLHSASSPRPLANVHWDRALGHPSLSLGWTCTCPLFSALVPSPRLTRGPFLTCIQWCRSCVGCPVESRPPTICFTSGLPALNCQVDVCLDLWHFVINKGQMSQGKKEEQCHLFV